MAANEFNETTILDDQTLNLGTSKDFKIKYDSGDNRLEIADTSNVLLARLSTAGALTLTSTITADGFASGTWTPTITGVANVASSANPIGYYVRYGAYVTGTFYVEVTPTAGASTATTVGVTFPIASNTSSARHAIGAGVARRGGTSFVNARAYADTTNDRFEVEFASIDTNAHVVVIPFSYTII